MTSPTWTPPPTMPADLLTLPIGKNGMPLVYVGMGMTFKRVDTDNETGLWALIEEDEKWDYGGWSGTADRHFAAECDSDICRLNQWGDFAPVHPIEPCKDAQPTTLAAYLASIESAIKEADEAMQKATELAAAWAKELQARRDIRERLQGGNAEAWYRTGRIDGRAHAPMRKNFPLHP